MTGEGSKFGDAVGIPHPNSVAFTGAVLAGGRSRRMGTDKALVLLAGRPLLVHALDILLGAGASQLLVIGGAPAVRRAAMAAGAIPMADIHADQGPVAGIARAVEAAEHRLVAVLACDTPFVTPRVIRALVEAAGDGPGAVATVGGRLEPLIAVFSRAHGAALGLGGPAGHATAGLVRVELTEPALARNLNTPTDVAEAEAELALRLRSTWTEDGGR